MHAVDCARAAGLEVPRDVAQARLLKSGSWSAPANTAATCSELASGPDAICYNLNSHEAPFSMPWGGLPRNYAFLAKPLTSGTSVAVGGWCQLVRNKQHTQQFYAGKAKANWLIPPSLQQMNTAQGVVMLNFGTVEFISTAPGRHIVLAVVR